MSPAKSFEVLLVEDNPGDVFLTQEAFREGNLPLRLGVVGDGEEALSYLRRAAPFEKQSGRTSS